MLSVNGIRQLVQRTVFTALDLLFPPHCVGCERVGQLLCPHCLVSVKQAPERVIDGLDGICVRAEYDGVIRAAIHALKYERQPRLYQPLGMLLVQAVDHTDWLLDVVTAVPLHSNRLHERGYNQAALLGCFVAHAYDRPFFPAAVKRMRETPSQIHLNAQERRANVAGAFAADARLVAGKTVLIVDDVLTTGATLVACAEALRRAGAVRVMGAVMAGAQLSP
ncbi:MAG: ComF family protein [Anaerolineae bacterium]|nr:ComF family protein [Anaerolineae bacterium]